MKLFKRLLILLCAFFKNLSEEFRSAKRQIPYLMMYGWPKFIIVASKADADACASPMAFLLAKKLRVNQVWWRQISAKEKVYKPRGFEHFVQPAYFDVGGEFDGELIDGKLVKPGKLRFDHHQKGFSLNHCATSLVTESFGLKDPVLTFIGEFVRRVDTGKPGEAHEMLRGNMHGPTMRGAVIVISRFFDSLGEQEMLTIIDQVESSLKSLRYFLQTVKDKKRYEDYVQELHNCSKFLKAIYDNDWEYVSTNVTTVKAEAKAVIAKLCDPDPVVDNELYLMVYGIENNNAKILGAISPLVNGLKNDISRSEQIRNGCLAFRAFYNQESLRQKIIRDCLPGGKFKHLKINNPDGSVARVLLAEDVNYDGPAMRVVTRHSFYESIDLVICGSPNGQLGMILIDPLRREVLSLKRFKDVLVLKYPAQKSSFLHNNEFVLYLNKDVQGKDKISFTDVVALAREIIETPLKAELLPVAEVRQASAPKARVVATEVMM